MIEIEDIDWTELKELRARALKDGNHPEQMDVRISNRLFESLCQCDMFDASDCQKGWKNQRIDCVFGFKSVSPLHNPGDPDRPCNRLFDSITKKWTDGTVPRVILMREAFYLKLEDDIAQHTMMIRRTAPKQRVIRFFGIRCVRTSDVLPYKDFEVI